MTGMFKVLYNDCYGSFDFSDAFLAEFNKRTGRDLDTQKALFHLGPNSIRCNPIAIAIFEEYGAEWCSGKDSYLAVRELSTVFAHYWEIDEYDGNETVRADVNAALVDCLDTFMQTRDAAILEEQYAEIKAAAKSMWPASLSSKEPVTITPPVLKQEAETASNGYSYFDSNSGCA
jgi:hypothetical protein